MVGDPRPRPVVSPFSQPGPAPGPARPQVSPALPSLAPQSRQEWPEGALALAQGLQSRLVINDRDWHALKAQRSRRASEQIAAALVQLLAADHPADRAPTPARLDAIALLEHAIGWLKAEVSDPGCPSHGR